MFSELLGLGGSLMQGIFGLGASQQQYDLAEQQLALQRRAMNAQTSMSWANFQIMQDQLKREQELQRYQQGIDAQNRGYLTEEYGTRLSSQQRRADMATAERQAMIERQLKVDKEAAAQQQRALTEYLSNKDLARSERAYAQQLLEDAKRTASGEADEDRRRYYQERFTAQQERQFGIDQLRRTQDIALRERGEDAAIRNDLVSRAGGMSSAVQEALARLGSLDAPERVTSDDIAGAVDQRMALYTADADRAAQIAASQNEASLARAGLDASSVGTDRRAQVAEKAQQMFARARMQAQDEALRYINGKQDTLLAGFKGALEHRAQTVNEAMAPYSAGADVLARLPQIRSANDYRTPVEVGSGNFVRNLSSANNYRAPVDLGTGRYESALLLTSGLGNTLNLPSAAAAQDINAGSRTSAPIAWNISNPAGYGSLAMQGMSSANQTSAALYQAMMNRGDNYMKGAMGSLGSSAADFGKFLDGKNFGANNSMSFGQWLSSLWG